MTCPKIINEVSRPGKRDHITMENITMLSMGKSTISTGPFSIAIYVELPEGTLFYHE